MIFYCLFEDWEILQLFRDLYKAVTRDEKVIVWQKMSDFIQEKLKEEGTAQRGLKNLQIWCQSKIAHMSTVEVIREWRKEEPVMYV